MTRHFTVSRSRDFDKPAGPVFAAWLDPANRAISETPEGSGMRHLSVATKEGESGEIVVTADGVEIGRMHDTIRILRAPRILVIQAHGVFAGRTSMTMQNTFHLTDRHGGTGCGMTGTTQICVPGDGPTEAQVAQGWDGMFDRFAALLGAEPSTGETR